MDKFVIHGGKPLFGEVVISGAKNAAVAILPAALLVSGKCRIENVPNISDVRILMNIIARMGAKITSPERNVVEIDCSEVTCTEPDADLVKKMRASYYLMGAQMSRYGKAHVAYIPGDCVVGLSKIPRVVEFYARFPQIQERMTRQIAELIQKELNPKGVAVVLEASHMCMTMRGVKKPGATMVTTQLLGRFKTDEKTRAEFMSRIYAPR